ncbi:TonB-dependent receptor SusC [Polaribacter huanghezhanensis]|uniref:TonB-dependent receptor n=1 Tax=Polaribacter huanghezhanensis TaxID=1354726 RepID=UPI002647427A|nr:TonB-dependent receptor [Polaribacter huanghezhanensis]WKD85749.1 TonB-dependent receptor SusC [Polaribacter huanghezhanensis]
MKKNIFFLFLFTSMLVNSQSFIISGKIVDENKEPLVSATVFIKNANKGTSSDFDGKYQLKIPEGTYKIEVRFIGYKSTSKTVTISNQNVVVNFDLQPEENVLDEVLVAAVRVKANSPVTHSNLSKKEIEKRNLGQDIPILLNYLPSVVTSSDAGAGIGYTYINVRGSNAERVNVTINGIPYNDAESQGTFWVNMGDFASSTQSLQLQRGVGTSTNGTAAFGASLNILTDAISEKPFAEISNSFGSFNTKKHTVKFSTGKINEHIEIAGRLSKIYSDGYIDRAFTDLKSYFLQASYIDENTLIKAITFGGKEKTYQAWAGIDAAQLAANRRQNPYTYENEIDNYQQDHYQLHWNEKLTENWSTNIGLNFTKGQGYFEQYKADKKPSDYANIVVATNNGKTDLIVRRWLDNTFYVANFNATYKKEGLEIISGFSYSNYSNKHFGEVIWAKQFAATATIRDKYYESNSKKNDFSMFSKATFKVGEHISFYADVQYRNVTFKTNGLTSDRNPIAINENFGFFNPKFGATYQLNENQHLYFSFAVANKEPNRNDFENGITTPENLNDYELGWRLKDESITLNTNVYYMLYKNQLVLTGAIDGVGAPVRATSGKSYRLGLEIDADIKVSNQFNIRPNIAFSDNKNAAFVSSINGNLTALGNTTISFSPAIIAGNALVYSPTENLQFSFLSKYVGKQFMSNLNSAVSANDVLKSYFTSDINFTYVLKPKSVFSEVVFTGLINNIFNKEYVDRGYYYTYDDTWSVPNKTTTLDGAGYYPQATRNFLVGVTLKF